MRTENNKYQIPVTVQNDFLEFIELMNEDEGASSVGVDNTKHVVCCLLNELCDEVEYRVEMSSSSFRMDNETSLQTSELGGEVEYRVETSSSSFRMDNETSLQTSVITCANDNKRRHYSMEDDESHDIEDNVEEEDYDEDEYYDDGRIDDEDGNIDDDDYDNDENDDDIEITKTQAVPLGGLQKKSNTGPKRKRRKKNPNQRKNIRNIFTDTQLGSKTQLLRDKENERLKRLGLEIPPVPAPIVTPVVKTVLKRKPSAPVSSYTEVICLDSDSDDDASKIASVVKKTIHNEILILSSDSEDDLRSEGEIPFDKKVQADDYYSELGEYILSCFDCKQVLTLIL